MVGHKKPRTVLYRRKQWHRTDYGKRLKLLLSPSPRLAVRFTNQRVLAQVLSFKPQGDVVLVSADSSSLQKLGWTYSGKNIPAAYLSGFLIGTKALEKKQKKVILDTGFKSFLHKGKLGAFLKGVVDAGLDSPFGKDDIFPSADRIQGKHIEQFASKLGDKTGGQFTQYLKNKSLPQQMSTQFEQVKKKIKG